MNWIILAMMLLGLMILDNFVTNQEDKIINLKGSLWRTAVCVLLAALFGFYIYVHMGLASSVAYVTGYVIELALSVDNLFVFILLFNYFKIPAAFQHRVLSWGIFGAVVSRLLFILAGVELVERFRFALYLLGLLLILAAVRMILPGKKSGGVGDNIAVRLVKRLVPVTNDIGNGTSFVRQQGRILATPLLVTIIVIEITDILFAVDSIPAILAITQNSFLVFSSNLFAVMCLRSLYFSVAGVMNIFHYLKYGLSVILAFVGLKIILRSIYPIGTLEALLIVGAILLLSIAVSMVFPLKHEPGETQQTPGITKHA